MNILRLVVMMLFLVFITPCRALGASGIVSDDFSGPGLDTGLWKFVDPLGDAGLKLTGTNIEIAVPPGKSHSSWTDGNLAPRIMQKVGNGDFEIEVRFDARMNQAYMMQGIVVQQDANNFLRFEFFSDGTDTRIFAAALAGSGLPLTPTIMNNSVIGGASSPVPLHMRVKRKGGRWTQSYSTDGTTWTRSAAFTYGLNVRSAGLYAGNEGPNAPGFTGSADYFFNAAAPIIPGDSDSVPPVIAVWYGNSQVFGQTGVPQLWVNILGNVSDPSGISSLSYSVNGGAYIPLSTGPDGLRLDADGDFNIELPYAELACAPELNKVVIRATDSSYNRRRETVTVKYICGTKWPETYSLDWSAVTRISDAAQVVDGNWALGVDGIRTASTGYDRLVAIGDITWDDYEVSVPVTIHSMGHEGLVGIATRWQGHHDWGGKSPREGWWPLGAIGAFGWFDDAGDYRMHIMGNDGFTIADDPSGLNLTPEEPYIFKVRAETIGRSSVYSMKIWEAGTLEPLRWNLRGVGVAGELKQGSALLVAHKADASFGDVVVTPGPFHDDTTPPVISNIKGTPDAFSATVSWTTDESSAGWVEYGRTKAYEMGSVFSDSFESSHSVSLAGLTPETLYHIRIFSADLYSNSVSSSDATFVTTPNQSTIVSDAFNSDVLAGFWKFVDPVGDVTLTMTGASAEISIPAGTSHDLWTAANLAPRLMQPANDRDFEIEVKFASDLNVQYVMQGVLVEQDDNNYVRFDLFGEGLVLRVFASTMTNGTALIRSNKVIGAVPATAPFYMRIKREGDRWTQAYSFDGQLWNTAAVFNHELKVNSVGPFAGNAVDNSAFTGRIDYFLNTASLKVKQKITVTSPAPANAAHNSSFTVSAKASSGLAVAITTSGACSGSGAGSAKVTITSESGTCTVSYNQQGNRYYRAAPEVEQITNAKPAVAPVGLSVAPVYQ